MIVKIPFFQIIMDLIKTNDRVFIYFYLLLPKNTKMNVYILKLFSIALKLIKIIVIISGS